MKKPRKSKLREYLEENDVTSKDLVEYIGGYLQQWDNKTVGINSIKPIELYRMSGLFNLDLDKLKTLHRQDRIAFGKGVQYKYVDPFLIPNTSYSTLGHNKKYIDKYEEQRCFRGFDDTELVDLKTTVREFLYPRLKAKVEKLKKDKKSVGEMSKVLEQWESLTIGDIMNYIN